MDQLARVGLRAPEGPYETLAGLVATELGRIPEVGDTVAVAGWRIDVVDASGRRAARLLLHAPRDTSGPDSGSNSGPNSDSNSNSNSDSAKGEL
jgi:CBS domain containing-hemolysin-like protein